MHQKDKIRNVAIIAHVDHGKTTLVDQLFKHGGLFRENQVVAERLMDSIDIEKERGITIQSKNGACNYKDYRINIIDTPGHADFGGEVERVLNMADGAVFLVDAAEGPMPQSYFVLKKAVNLNLPVIVLVNKIDKNSARPDWAVDQVFDLLVGINAEDHVLDFPVIYAIAREGIFKNSLDDEAGNANLLFDLIIKKIPVPKGEADQPVQFMVSNINYSQFMGRLAIGKLTSGTLKVNQQIAIYAGVEDKAPRTARVTKLFEYHVNQLKEVDVVGVGDIFAIAGVEDIRVGETITDPLNPIPLPMLPIDPPTISMTFMANDSPFSGQEGDYVTSRHLKDRLQRELLSDVALQVEDSDSGIGYKVAGRGELHLSILIEKMRREGYEFQVSRPQVILKTINGEKMEPYEEVTIEVDETTMGPVIESMGGRKGIMNEMTQDNGVSRLSYRIPTRGLLGYISEFMTQTKGLGVMYSRFLEYGKYVGVIRTRQNGVLISGEQATTVAFALNNLQERGRLFMGPGVDVYEGQIIGENARDDDMIVNPAKSKKLTNMRASGSDDGIFLTTPTIFSLEQCLAFIADDELVEVTPKAIRLRKKHLKETDRKRHK